MRAQVQQRLLPSWPAQQDWLSARRYRSTLTCAYCLPPPRQVIIRPMYSSPPLHGAAVVATVLGDPQLWQRWRQELAGMAGRISSVRRSLHEALLKVGGGRQEGERGRCPAHAEGLYTGSALQQTQFTTWMLWLFKNVA